MSDIAIRMDGLILLAVLAASAAIYGLIALLAWATALARPAMAARPRKIARSSALMGLSTLAGFAALFTLWASGSPVHHGPNWLDALAWPWLALFGAGCWGLARL
ncbi:hypothetical protein [Bosea sp. 124]|uniref:hypothetical protein n=1 Tax=Bosea sp. 124 TaxID=2135642 RepID=UPI000D342985|nr:hypothetical protein [Bosea sp. 124]PTM41857.1 hypothetical protein C8D03_3434 [Bosea sp. 124]